MRSKNRFTFRRMTLLALAACVLVGPMSANAQSRPQAINKTTGVPEGYTIVEGDIQMPIDAANALRNQLKSSTNAPQATFKTDLWPNGVVPFEFDGSCGTGSTTCVSAANQTAMLAAMSVVQVGVNIRFQQCANNSCGGSYVHIQANPQFNNSAVGRQGGSQIINIVSWGNTYIIAHELMHCLGMYHEQSRPDRDNFVTINTGNVQANLAGNFSLQSGADVYGSYDFDSLMHYGQCDFSLGCGVDASGNPIQSCNVCPGQETIVVKAPYNADPRNWQTTMGQRTHLSDLDRLTLRLLYSYPNWRFVDANYGGQKGSSNGSFLRPYTSFLTGVGATPVGGVLWVQPGFYSTNVPLSKAIGVKAPLGGVQIGKAVPVSSGVVATKPGAASVSAASYNGEISSGSIAALFGADLATGLTAATTLPLPTTLGGASVKITDNAGVIHDAPLFFVSSGQINFLVPDGLDIGPAVVSVYRGGVSVATGSVPITQTAPGLFTSDSSGQGSPIAYVLRVRGEEQSIEPLVEYNAELKRFVPIPIDLGPESDQLFLVMFGTGFRQIGSQDAVSVLIGEKQADILFVGPTPGLAGLDQVNLRLPRALAGKGDVSVQFAAENRAANAVTINVR